MRLRFHGETALNHLSAVLKVVRNFSSNNSMTTQALLCLSETECQDETDLAQLEPRHEQDFYSVDITNCCSKLSIKELFLDV